MINVQQVTLSYIKQMAQLYISSGTKIGHHKKGQDLTDGKKLSLQQGISQLPYLNKSVRWQIYSHIHNILIYSQKVSVE